MKKHILLNDFDEDFALWGILSNEIHDYKLAFKLNSHLHWNLTKKKNHIIYLEQEAFEFAVYQYYNKDEDVTLQLISNLSIPNKQDVFSGLFADEERFMYLLPKWKSYNFLIKQIDFEDNDTFSVHLSGLSFIQGVTSITLERKDKNNLILS